MAKKRKTKARPASGAATARPKKSERDATRMFELGEQITALRQERDLAQEELAAVDAEATKAQAELAEVVKVLDKLAPRDQYGSISAAVREALEAHRKQRDEAARLGAVEAKAAQAHLEEAQAQIASLKANIPLGTAELQGKVAELESELRMAYRESAECRAILDAVARALSGQDPGPLDAAFRVAVDVAMLRGRVTESEAALVAWRAMRQTPPVDGAGSTSDWTRSYMHAEALLDKAASTLGQAPGTDDDVAGNCDACGGPVRHRPGVPGEYDHDWAACDAAKKRAALPDDATPPDDDLLRVVGGFLRTWDEHDGDHSSTTQAIQQAVQALRRVVERAKGRPADAPNTLRARAQRMETALRDSEDGWEQIREWAKSDHVLQYDDGDVPVQEFAETHRKACSEAVAFEPHARQDDAAPDATNGSSAPGREDILAHCQKDPAERCEAVHPDERSISHVRCALDSGHTGGHEGIASNPQTAAFVQWPRSGGSSEDPDACRKLVESHCGDGTTDDSERCQAVHKVERSGVSVRCNNGIGHTGCHAGDTNDQHGPVFVRWRGPEENL